MTIKPKLSATAVALALSGIAFPAGAAGLGKLTVLSGLGQPLRAEIEVSATSAELSTMSARLASIDAFRQAGLEYGSALAGLKVDVTTRAGSKPVVRISSDRPMDEPFLNILLELNWAAGRLVREYTFLLDPPESLLAPQAVAPTVPPKAAAAPSPRAPAAEKPAAAMPREGTVEVKRGDTLHGIATQTKPEGVTLNQMMIALFRANREAFIGGNINRLRAGRILTVPDAQTAAAIAPGEAGQIVRAQGQEFAAYRQQLAGAVAATPAATEAPSPAAAGKVTPKPADVVPQPLDTKDQLKVSKAEAAAKEPGREVATTDRAAQARITALEEDLVAKEKALKDANLRLGELEKSVQELQQVLELKNQSLAQLQAQAGTGAPAAVTEPPKPAAAPPAEPAPPPPAAVQPPIAPPSPPPPPSPEPGLLSELLSGPLAWIGGAVILAILGYFGLRRRQPAAPAAGPAAAGATTAPATHSAFGTAGGQSVDTSSSSIQTDFSQAGLGAIDTEEGVDPVAEADVYMAYGRDAQAEEILLDALKNEPTRHAIHVKLLEIYAQRKDVRQFDARASDLYAQTGGVGPEWEKAATMGRKLDPSNPMFGAPGRAEPVEETRFTEKTIVVSSPDKLRDTWTMPGELGQIASAVEGGIQDRTVVLEAPLVESGATAVAEAGKGEIDFDLGLDFSTTLNKPKPAGSLVESTYAMEPGSARKGAVDLPVEESVETGAPTENLIDFDLGKQPGARAPEDQSGTIDLESTDISGNVVDFALEETRVPASPSARVVDLEHTDIGGNLMHFEKAVRETPAASPVVDLEKTDFGGEVLDFNFQLEGTEGKPGGKETPPAARAPDLTGISLDLAAQGPEGQPSAGGENPDVVTKLELAKAYEEMGDKEGARELLDEVLKEGSDAQKERAREMLGRLG